MSGAWGEVSPPLLPEGRRRAAALAVAVCGVVTLLLGVIVHGHATADGLDRTTDHWLHQSIGRYRGILDLISLPGRPVPVTVLAAALVAACLVARRWRAAALATIAVLGASALGEFLLKPLVGRRMGGGTGSFPSGHAVGVFALAVAVCVLLAQLPRLKPAPRRLLSLGALLAATAVSLAMVGLNRHYVTDIVGGAAVGTAVVLLTAFALDWLGARRWPGQGPPRRALNLRDPAGAFVSWERTPDGRARFACGQVAAVCPEPYEDGPTSADTPAEPWLPGEDSNLG